MIPTAARQQRVRIAGGRRIQRGEMDQVRRPPKNTLPASITSASPASTAQLRRVTQTDSTHRLTNPSGMTIIEPPAYIPQREFSTTLSDSHGHRPSFSGPWMNSTSRQGK